MPELKNAVEAISKVPIVIYPLEYAEKLNPSFELLNILNSETAALPLLLFTISTCAALFKLLVNLASPATLRVLLNPLFVPTPKAVPLKNNLLLS